MKAYIQQSQFDEAALKQVVEDFPIPGASISYSITEPEDKNWNEEWEKNFFQPIVIDNRCVIHSTFHKDYPRPNTTSSSIRRWLSVPDTTKPPALS